MIRQELYLSSPWVNAAGMLGCTLPARWPVPGIELGLLGAFITNPLSLSARSPANDRSAIRYPGGALLHSGLPNPGLERALRHYAERWAQSNIPVWVHLAGSSPEEIQRMVRRLEGYEGVLAVELGLPPRAGIEDTLKFVEAAYGELPLIVQIPLLVASEAWVSQLAALGASALSLGAPRGTALGEEGKPVSGRLYGPSLFPLTLHAVQVLRSQGLPVIAGPGVYRRQDAQALLDAGALAVQLDTVLWRGWAGD
jgi:dihydroorotate dehydrogenase (NAD+) catalytic subunit